MNSERIRTETQSGIAQFPFGTREIQCVFTQGTVKKLDRCQERLQRNPQVLTQRDI
jgi:hypothetical protein